MTRKRPLTNLPAPFLQRITLRDGERPEGYPFDLPWLTPDFEMEFTTPVTIFVGENGVGKSTLIEAIGGLAGFDEAGGGNGYRPVDHAKALDKSGTALADKLRAAWLPKVTQGWFFRAESFYSVARYLDEVAVEAWQEPPDFLSYSHGEGFLRFFAERCARQGLYLFDEPESAPSPERQLDLLALLDDVQRTARAQVIMSTHSPILMALPGARVLQMTRHGLDETDFRQTRHFRQYRDFCEDPRGFVWQALQERRG
jgi:predicted ATPase